MNNKGVGSCPEAAVRASEGRALRLTAVFLLTAVLLAALCACSLEYSSLEEDGPFSYACGKKKAFVYEYRWDGTEEGLIVEIPDTFGKRRVVSVGGFYGRGLPMPFSVDITDWLKQQPGELLKAVQPDGRDPDTGEKIVPDETVTLDFTVLTGQNIKETRIELIQRWFIETDGRVTEYTVRTAAEAK